MRAWSIEELAAGAQGTCVYAGTHAFSGRVVQDSRKVQPGDLFIAIVGKNHDGHAFLPQAIAAGAAAILVQRHHTAEILAGAQAAGVGIVRVDDTTRALGHLASAYRAELTSTRRTKVIAVGGSNGKTTTKRILHAVLAEKAPTHASPASFNNNIGMPLTLLEVEPQHAFAVLEIGTSAPGEIAELGGCCRPDVAVITNIGLEHLEKLNDLQGVAAEEACITNFIPPNGMLVTTTDHKELNAALQSCTGTRISVSLTDKSATLCPSTFAESFEGVAFTLSNRRFTLPLLGRHNVANALLAIAVARPFGVTDDQIQAGFSKVTPAGGRLEQKKIHGVFVLHDAYNANPSSMEAALGTFARLTPAQGRFSRKIAVLADMLELGEASDGMHRHVGALASTSNLHRLIAIGPAMKHAAAAAAAAGLQTDWFARTADVGPHLANLLKPGDALLLKGSRGMKLETLLDALHHTPAHLPA